MADDPAGVLDALDRAEDAYDGYTTGALPTNEGSIRNGIDPLSSSFEKDVAFWTRVERFASTTGTTQA